MPLFAVILSLLGNGFLAGLLVIFAAAGVANNSSNSVVYKLLAVQAVLLLLVWGATAALAWSGQRGWAFAATFLTVPLMFGGLLLTWKN
ncbi:MAG TPA: hypothetical protein VGN52_06835 [Burkholderiales bacterium]|jgi:hypothetical protein